MHTAVLVDIQLSVEPSAACQNLVTNANTEVVGLQYDLPFFPWALGPNMVDQTWELTQKQKDEI